VSKIPKRVRKDCEKIIVTYKKRNTVKGVYDPERKRLNLNRQMGIRYKWVAPSTQYATYNTHLKGQSHEVCDPRFFS
jgi:hypothetical protein